MKDSNNLKGLIFSRQQKEDPHPDRIITSEFLIYEPMLDYESVIERYKKQYPNLKAEFSVKPAVLIIKESKNEEEL